VSEHYWAYSFFNLYLVVNNKQPGRSSINQGWVAVSLQFTTTASGATTTIAARLRRLVPHPATARPSIPCLVFPAPACTNRHPAFVAPSTSIGKLRLPNRLSLWPRRRCAPSAEVSSDPRRSQTGGGPRPWLWRRRSPRGA